MQPERDGNFHAKPKQNTCNSQAESLSDKPGISSGSSGVVEQLLLNALQNLDITPNMASNITSEEASASSLSPAAHEESGSAGEYLTLSTKQSNTSNIQQQNTDSEKMADSTHTATEIEAPDATGKAKSSAHEKENIPPQPETAEGAETSGDVGSPIANIGGSPGIRALSTSDPSLYGSLPNSPELKDNADIPSFPPPLHSDRSSSPNSFKSADDSIDNEDTTHISTALDSDLSILDESSEASTPIPAHQFPTRPRTSSDADMSDEPPHLNMSVEEDTDDGSERVDTNLGVKGDAVTAESSANTTRHKEEKVTASSENIRSDQSTHGTFAEQQTMNNETSNDVAQEQREMSVEESEVMDTLEKVVESASAETPASEGAGSQPSNTDKPSTEAGNEATSTPASKPVKDTVSESTNKPGEVASLAAVKASEEKEITPISGSTEEGEASQQVAQSKSAGGVEEQKGAGTQSVTIYVEVNAPSTAEVSATGDGATEESEGKPPAAAADAASIELTESQKVTRSKAAGPAHVEPGVCCCMIL